MNKQFLLLPSTSSNNGFQGICKFHINGKVIELMLSPAKWRDRVELEVSSLIRMCLLCCSFIHCACKARSWHSLTVTVECVATPMWDVLAGNASSLSAATKTETNNKNNKAVRLRFTHYIKEQKKQQSAEGEGETMQDTQSTRQFYYLPVCLAPLVLFENNNNNNYAK